MRIAVTTPTGNVGRQVVASLVRAGVRPRVLVRDPARLDPALAALVDPVAVDLTDADAVRAATEGVDTLYWVSPSSWSGDPIAEHARLGTIAAQAVTANQIPRVVFQSSVGAEKRHGVGEIDGLARTEEALDSTGADVVHLRCGFFFSNLLFQLDDIRAGTLRVVLPVDRPMAWVAPRDIAEVAAGWLLGTHWSGRVVHAVHGPADLSWTEAAAIVSEACDRPVRVEQVSDERMRADLTGAGLDPALVDATLGMSIGMREDFVPEQPRTPATTTSTTLAAWCREHLCPEL